ncbi:glycosyltransferase family 9 protein [Magnetospira sp. QH-2]|uniref:glycosyltransferase family 9 protein n=1 Tax=Magnetospira sp. (strain QH-2) TaxID=1288970 RepID=UPI0003E818AE|nr:glycosyltransferase family 9 protein [Magnetospira sp. QH-2]CCQ72223.1 GT9 : distantly related to LPS heptosyl-2-transferase [Magnetospira sp. QH-2]
MCASERNGRRKRARGESLTAVDSSTDPGQVEGLPARRITTDAFWRLMPGRMPRRWWLFRPFDWLARHVPVWGKKRGVLVVRMDGIGDMVLFRRALDHYAEALGVEQQDITVLGCTSWERVAHGVFAGYRVEVLDEHRFAKNLWYRLRTAVRVRRVNPETVINDSYFRRPLMADSLAWICGASTNIASLPHISDKTRSVYHWYLSQATRIIDTGPYPTHETLRHFNFLSVLAGREITPEAPAFDWKSEPPEFADEGPYVVLNPGSNEYGRRWPFDKYLDIARRCVKAGYRVAVVGSPKEAPTEEGLLALQMIYGVHNLIGQTSLPGLLDLMKHASAVVSNDTGPMHLAIALGTPTVAVIGGGHFHCFIPYPDDVRPPNVHFLWQEMDCYHCFWACPKRETDKDSFPCVAAVETDAVWAKLEPLLKTSAAD